MLLLHELTALLTICQKSACGLASLVDLYVTFIHMLYSFIVMLDKSFFSLIDVQFNFHLLSVCSWWAPIINPFLSHPHFIEMVYLARCWWNRFFVMVCGCNTYMTSIHTSTHYYVTYMFISTAATRKRKMKCWLLEYGHTWMFKVSLIHVLAISWGLSAVLKLTRNCWSKMKDECYMS